MSKTENSAGRTNLGPQMMKDIIKALRDGSSAKESVNNVKVQVPLPELLELLAGHFGDDEVLESSHLKAMPAAPEPKEKVRAKPESGPNRKPSPLPVGKSVVAPPEGNGLGSAAEAHTPVRARTQ